MVPWYELEEEIVFTESSCEGFPQLSKEVECASILFLFARVGDVAGNENQAPVWVRVDRKDSTCERVKSALDWVTGDLEMNVAKLN